MKKIFKNIKNPIKLAPIGRNCPKPHCALLYSFLGMGVIPSIKTPSYSKLLDRKNILSEFMNKKLDFKFSDYQTEYTQEEQEKINTEVKETMQKLCCKCQNTRRKISFKNKLRLKIYNYLKTKLEKKGLV